MPVHAQAIVDPAPAQVQPRSDPAAPALTPQKFDRLKFFQAPKPLPKDAVTSAWPSFLGPNHDAKSPETKLLHQFPESGPVKVWEIIKGDGYTSPAISDDYIVLFHSIDGKETIECLQPETGLRYWVYDYDAPYRDRFGYANGPRGSPVIAGDLVVTLGVTCKLTCLELRTGKVIWQRDLRAEFDTPQDFFGHGGSPLVMDGKVILNLGGREPRLAVAAFDLQTGKLLWGVKDEWGASYATPVPAKIHGQQTVMVFTGGESDPATGGLLCINPGNGQVHERFPWRADDYISVNATSPVIVPDRNGVFITTAYPKGRPLGGVYLEFDEELKAKEVWRSPKFAVHWMNPVLHEGYLYGIDGETERIAKLTCFEAATGKPMWRKDVMWDDKEVNAGRPGQLGIQRASLLHVDGKFLCLGELGTLMWMDLTPDGVRIEAQAQLFYAPHTWCLPALSRGLLYVSQNYEEQVRGKTGQRFLCYDLRSNE